MEIINFEILALISVLTTLSTECVKKLLDKGNKDYASNIIAVICSIVISGVICVVYPVIMNGAVIDAQLIFKAVVMAFFAVLCATLTFDKVVQALKQIEG